MLELGDSAEPDPDPEPDPDDPDDLPNGAASVPTDVTVFGLGAIYDRQDYDLDFRYELSLAPAGTKHTLSAGSAFALSDAVFGSLRFTF